MITQKSPHSVSAQAIFNSPYYQLFRRQNILSIMLLLVFLAIQQHVFSLDTYTAVMSNQWHALTDSIEPNVISQFFGAFVVAIAADVLGRKFAILFAIGLLALLNIWLLLSGNQVNEFVNFVGSAACAGTFVVATSYVYEYSHGNKRFLTLGFMVFLFALMVSMVNALAGGFARTHSLSIHSLNLCLSLGLWLWFGLRQSETLQFLVNSQAPQASVRKFLMAVQSDIRSFPIQIVLDNNNPYFKFNTPSKRLHMRLLLLAVMVFMACVTWLISHKLAQLMPTLMASMSASISSMLLIGMQLCSGLIALFWLSSFLDKGQVAKHLTTAMALLLVSLFLLTTQPAFVTTWVCGLLIVIVQACFLVCVVATYVLNAAAYTASWRTISVASVYCALNVLPIMSTELFSRVALFSHVSMSMSFVIVMVVMVVFMWFMANSEPSK